MAYPKKERGIDGKAILMVASSGLAQFSLPIERRGV